ncbi:peptidase associated/transthyretin-like domain-containing protein [Thermomonospora amylolytica]|uniref:hypothetical protein n=1 Tax=Thermomonospora amylolytica TaxID=1411117 RepID=UPI000E6D37D1|nr:hypothetical protein [Thermomonospora amylolytica]
MRRLATVLTALAIAPAPAFLALTPPAAVAATVSDVIAGAQAVEGGYRIAVRVSSDQAIERVQAVVHHPDGGATTVEDFQIVQRTALVWEARSASPIPLSIGDHTIGISVWDVTGTRTDKADAGAVAVRLATRFASAAIVPHVINLVEDQVTVSGRLLRRTVEGTEEPYPGATIQVEGMPYTFVTDEQGVFSGKIRTGGKRTIRVSYAYGPVYGAASADIQVSYTQLPTRVSISPVPQGLRVGDSTTLSGKLEWRRPTGEWEPLGGRTVEISFLDLETGTEQKLTERVTGADGSFSPVPVTITRSGRYIASFNRDRSEIYYTSAGSGGYIHYAYYRTQIVGANADPEPVGAGSKVTMRGQVIRQNAPADQAMAAGVPVLLHFSPDGRQWEYVTTGTTDAQGRFMLSGVARRDGYWRAYYEGRSTGEAPSAIGDLQAISGADHVDVRYRTRVSSFNASPEPVTKGRPITVQGRLDRLVGSSWKALTGASVTVYFKPNGSTVWTAMSTVKTSSTGWFKKSFTASKDGTWMVKYNGSSANLGVQGPGDYVDVR